MVTYRLAPYHHFNKNPVPVHTSLVMSPTFESKFALKLTILHRMDIFLLKMA